MIYHAFYNSKLPNSPTNLTDQMMESNPTRVLISGHLHLTQEDFDAYYTPKIDAHVAAGHHFVVGGAKGVDTMAQSYLAQLGVKNVTVFDVKDEKNLICSDFVHKNGFANFLERDEALTANSDTDIAVLDQYGGGGSSTAANLVRRALGTAAAVTVMSTIRSASMPYEEKGPGYVCMRLALGQESKRASIARSRAECVKWIKKFCAEVKLPHDNATIDAWIERGSTDFTDQNEALLMAPIDIGNYETMRKLSDPDD